MCQVSETDLNQIDCNEQKYDKTACNFYKNTSAVSMVQRVDFTRVVIVN